MVLGERGETPIQAGEWRNKLQLAGRGGVSRYFSSVLKHVSA